jgi:hypothetical protein
MIRLTGSECWLKVIRGDVQGFVPLHAAQIQQVQVEGSSRAVALTGFWACQLCHPIRSNCTSCSAPLRTQMQGQMCWMFWLLQDCTCTMVLQELWGTCVAFMPHRTG